MKQENMTVTQTPAVGGTKGFEGTRVARKPVYSFFKRVFDILFSLIGIVLLFLPMLLVAIVIVIDSPGASPIYVQRRVGKGGKEFKFFKFRSMVPNAEAMLDTILDKNEMDGPAFKVKNDPRITRVGRFIRRTSIDELPQLWNVLKGDMSLVGPRPPLPREVAMYDARAMQRLSVTPGLTCYWQVQRGRNGLPFSEWLELDLKYIRKRSLLTDLKLLFMTVGAVLSFDGQ